MCLLTYLLTYNTPILWNRRWKFRRRTLVPTTSRLISATRLPALVAPPPTISPRSVPALTVFDPVTEQEVAVLIKNTPVKSCPLDPIRTWLLRQVATCITPVISRLCNLSVLSGLLLGRLRKVDLIILEGKNVCPSVRPSVRPSVHKKFLQFEWYLVYR